MNITQEANFYHCDSTNPDGAAPIPTLLCMNAECSNTNSSPFLLSDSFQYPMNVRIVSPKIYKEKHEQNEREMIEMPVENALVSTNQHTNIFSSPLLIQHNCSRNNTTNSINNSDKNGTISNNDKINSTIHTMV